MNSLLDQLKQQYQDRLQSPNKDYQKRKVIRKVYSQQNQMLKTSNTNLISYYAKYYYLCAWQNLHQQR